MKKLLFMTIAILVLFVTGQAQAKIVGEKGTGEIVGEKGSAGIIGEKGSEGVIGEKRNADAEIRKSNAQVELAYNAYKLQLEEMEKSLSDLRARIEANIKLLEKNRRFRSPKHGIRLRTSWQDALKQLEESKRKINVVKSSVVAPDMIR
jgi:hypothetical protein